MQLVKFRRIDGRLGVGVLDQETIQVLQGSDVTLAQWLARPRADSTIAASITKERLALSSVLLLPPVDHQEIWAAGVTYLRSKTAREEESAGAARFYDQVYSAPRPELFFKATARRVVGNGQPIRARADSRWSVPEPELALVIAPDLRIVGYTIGNDVSARDIEGENPLYLPQAKVYNQSCALGPAVSLHAPAANAEIRLGIERAGALAFEGATTLDRIVRPFTSLVEWLGKDNDFPDGVILLTGTGIVPPDDFTLQHGDLVSITIGGLGTLTNPVVAERAAAGR